MDLREMRWEFMDRNHLDQDRDWQQGFGNTVMKPQFP
jgi:hypothetical protein